MQVWPYIPDDWDVVRIGWFGMRCEEGKINDHVDMALWNDPPPKGPCYYCGVQGYVVNPANVDKVLERLKNSRLMYIDTLLGAPTPPFEDEQVVPPLKVFALQPPLINQNENFRSERVRKIPQQARSVDAMHGLMAFEI